MADTTTLLYKTLNETSNYDWNDSYTLLSDLTANSSETNDDGNLPTGTTLFDRLDVCLFLIIIYSCVFFSCLFGNLMVIFVVTFHSQMKSHTNFCLANLAIADLCIGIFCVYQNLISYLIQSWIFGEFLCKMYYFVDRMSQTASILILVVISFERFLAINYPIKLRQFLTLRRLQGIIAGVWLIGALISSPRLYYISTVPRSMTFGDEILCIPNQHLFNHVTSDICIFVGLYIIPFVIMTIFYLKISLVLWNSTNAPLGGTFQSKGSPRNPQSTGLHELKELLKEDPAFRERNNKPESPNHDSTNTTSSSTKHRETSFNGTCDPEEPTRERRDQARKPERHQHCEKEEMTKGVHPNLLEGRRRIVRLLILLVFTFGAFHLPFHARKMWQIYGSSFEGGQYSTLFTLSSNIFLYMNSAINPLLYAFLSKKFRRCSMEIVRCRSKRSRKFKRTLTVT